MQNMTFGQAVKTVFSKYAVFKGRARRAEYWWFYLFTLLVNLGLLFLVGLYNIIFLGKSGVAQGQLVFTIVSGAWSLAVLLPTCAVMVRRLHDVGCSGWLAVGYYLFSIVVAIFAFVGSDLMSSDAEMSTGVLVALGAMCLLVLAFGLVLFILSLIPGKKGDNKYGPDPKAEPETVDITFPAADSVAEATTVVSDAVCEATTDNQ